MSNQMGTPEERANTVGEFEAACSRFFEEIRRYCVSKAGNRERGEDIAQDALIKAFRAWGSFNDQGHGPKPWLYTIAYNALVSAGIKQSKLNSKMEYAYEDEDGNVDHGFDKYDFDNSVDTPEMLTIEKFGMAEIENAINSLEEEFREVAFQKFVVGLGNKEIAELLGIKQNTVGSKISRAREKLSEILREMAASYGIGLDEDKKK